MGSGPPDSVGIDNMNSGDYYGGAKPEPDNWMKGVLM